MSEDGGRTWSDASKGYTGAQVRMVVVDPGQPARVFAAARSGVFASEDGGTNWHGINSPSIDSIEWNALAIHPQDPQRMLGGMNVGGGLLVRTTDGGGTWKPVCNLETFGIGWRAIAFAPSDPDLVYAGSAGYYSAGSFDPYRAGMGIYWSTNGGATWTRTADDLARDAHVTALAVDPVDPRVVLAATTNHGLLRSTDGGSSWSEVRSTWSYATWPLAVSIDPGDPNLILVGVRVGGIFKSIDGGITWTHPVSGLMAESSVNSIVFDPLDPQVIYLADLSSGVYRSTDRGQTWQAFNTGLNMRAISSLAVTSDGLHLYTGSDGAGVFRFDLNGQPPEARLEPTAVPTMLPAAVATTRPSSPASSTAPVETPPATASGWFSLWIIGGTVVGMLLLVAILFLILHKRRA